MLLFNKMDNYRKSSVTHDQRLQRANTWLRSLDRIQQVISNEELRQTVVDVEKFIINETCIGTPLASANGENWAISAPQLDNETSASVLFVPLFMADAALSHYFAEISYPAYREALHSVLLPPCKISVPWRGILLFHEFSHAKHHINNDFRDQHDAHWVEEVAVFENEHKIMQEIFPDYTAKVNVALNEIEKSTEASHNISQLMKRIEWTDAFPDFLSKKEEGLARTAFMLDVVYSDINRFANNDTLKRKIDFTKRLYEKND
ncbi:MAG: hypothetical protein ACHQTE_01610 [Candidatus Saccharimonadales bacterium]